MNLKKVFFEKNRTLWTMYTLLTILGHGSNLLMSVILQQLTDVAIQKDMSRLVSLFIICLISIAGTLSILGLRCYIEARFLKRAMLRYKNTIFARLLEKGRRSFHHESTSTYISALTNDATSIEMNYLKGTVQIISYGIMFVGTIIVMVYYSPILTIAAVLLGFLPIVISMLSGNKLAATEKTVSDENANFVGTIKDMLVGFTVIKSFRAEKEIDGIYQNQNNNLEHVKYRRNMITGGISIFSTLGALISQFGVFIVGALLAIRGNGITPGVLIAFVNMMGILMSTVGQVPQLYGGRKSAMALIKKMEEAVAENTDQKDGAEIKEIEKGISLKNVSFGYTPDQEILKNVSLNFEAGKSYAVVGGSGSGKSTMLDVLMGNHDTYSGAVCYDGMELGEIRTDSLYDLIAVVQQSVFVFDSTIRDNITMFKEFPEEQVRRAIELSGLSKLIEEKGEEYLCGENGGNLSGGEKQRISIARCLLKETPVLVADEATAALDIKTAHDIMNAILEMQDLTRIIVTHQLDASLLKQYDEIVVMKKGVVEEQGTFEELLARKQYFYSLYSVAV